MTMHVPFSPNPLQVANEAQKMAQNAEGMESRLFQKVAVVSMGVVAVASVMQVLMPLLHQLNRKYDDEKREGRGR